MSYFCPVCNKLLTEGRTHTKFVEYNCHKDDITHHFSLGIDFVGTTAKIKVRVTDPNTGTKFYLKINYDEGFSQVWCNKKNFDYDVNRINIDHIFTPDYNPDKLIAKIKTYLVFA